MSYKVVVSIIVGIWTCVLFIPNSVERFGMNDTCGLIISGALLAVWSVAWYIMIWVLFRWVK